MSFRVVKLFIIFQILLVIYFLVYFTIIFAKNTSATHRLTLKIQEKESLKHGSLIKNENLNKTQNQKELDLKEKNGKGIRIFCMIFARPNIFSNDQVILLFQYLLVLIDEFKATVINNTWGKDCDKHFFIVKLDSNLNSNISQEINYPLPILQPAKFDNEAYKRLTDKVFRTFQDVYLRYHDFDWYLKADDDTFILVDNLKSFLKTKNPSMPITFGYDYKLFVNSGGGYHSGGAGYVLSNLALKRIGSKLISNYTFCLNTRNEDIDIAQCLRKLNVKPGKSIDKKGRERFHAYSIDTHYYGRYPADFLRYVENCIKKVSIIKLVLF